MKMFKYILFIFNLFAVVGYSQDCSRFDRWAECKPRIKDYNTYLQPKNIPVGINDTLTFNIVFEGNRDYILSFCSNKLYYPIHVRLTLFSTKKEVYDNATDDYPESIGIGFVKTQSLIVEISLIAEKLDADKFLRNDVVCVGMIMHWKNYFKK